MKKLIKMFKSLPREVRMMLAMAGLASPIGAIYFLQRFFKVKTFTLVLIVAGIILVVCLVGFLVTKVLGRGSKRRSQRMESELISGEPSGRVPADARAKIKLNNDKFISAVREMKRAFDTSVYDLPWYIVIGDSGCGKTTLINNGNLVFPGGKPEGYRLGTLDYNWWFSQDAVFIDMAGRLINPQEDADYREWQGFLDTVARGRKGFPINGCLVCVSAEHLLAEPPQKHEADANTVLERLRDLQKTLGVTFACYLVITKCDRILGFMQLFDRADKDIRVKKQIVGWSKEGRFDELYDPERFGEDFDRLYSRFSELRLRRLSDDADNIDLGFAYAFPEEFRELRAPLQTYLRTLFPPIKNPRGIKNLILRGVYFTSATQEGEVILKHMRERLGAEAADQLPSLKTLYPEPTPLFVRDLLFRKILPEHGLVFRHERDVERNRRLGRLLKWGSAALAVLLLGVGTWSTWKLGTLMGGPRQDALAGEEKYADPLLALNHCARLGKDIDSLKRDRLPVYMLSAGLGAERPVTDLGRIRMRMFEHGVLRSVFSDIGEALRQGPAELQRSTRDGDAAAQKYMDALVEYVTWFGCVGADTRPQHLDYARFKKLCAVVTSPESLIVQHKELLLAEASAYFAALRSNKTWRSPEDPMVPGPDGLDPTETIAIAVEHVYQHMKQRYATLSEGHHDERIAEWMRIQDQCRIIEESYAAIVGSDPEDLHTPRAVEEFKEEFQTQHAAFEEALSAVGWRLGTGRPRYEIPHIAEAILGLRKTWIDYDEKLRAGYLACELRSTEEAQQLLPSLQKGSDSAGLIGLDDVLWGSLYSRGLTRVERYEDVSYYEPERFQELVSEVDQVFAHIITLVKGGPQATDHIELSADAEAARAQLNWVDEQLPERGSESAAAGAGETIAQWIQELGEFWERSGVPSTATDVPSTLDAEKWRRDELVRFSKQIVRVVQRAEVASLLQRIEATVSSENVGYWGLAELNDDWRSPQPSAYSIPIPTSLSPGAGPQAKPKDRQVKSVRTGARRLPALGRGTPQSKGAPVPTRELRRGRDYDNEIPNCADPTYMSGVAEDCVYLLWLLRAFATEDYLNDPSESPPLNERCYDGVARAWRVYARRYAGAWHAAYRDKALTGLERLNQWDRGWERFASQFVGTEGYRRGADWHDLIDDEFQPALAEILHATRWATVAPEDDLWRTWYEAWMDAEGTFHDELREVESDVVAAIEEQWGERSFAVDASTNEVRSLGRAAPWHALANEFSQHWTTLARLIGANSNLRTRADMVASPGYEGRDLAPPIDKWGELSRIRSDSRLDDELLSGKLVEFEQGAQRLLNKELTDIVWSVQKKHFSRYDPPEGWPYLIEGQSYSGLATVDFESFKSFLGTVRRVEKFLKPIEKDLPTDDVSRARQQFYRQCDDWYAFLGLEEGPGGRLTAKPLENIKVQGRDALSDPVFKVMVQQGAQNDYDSWELDLGLKINLPAGGTESILRTPTSVEGGMRRERTVVWDWEAVPTSGDVSAELVGPLTDAWKSDGRKRLGKRSPLAFCAFLFGYGLQADGAHKTLCTFELRNPIALDSPKRTCGGMLVFTLDRPMPGPIKQLQRVSD